MKYILLMIYILPIIACSQTEEKMMKEIISDYEFKTHFAQVDDLEIAYIKEGKGEQTLLFIHGLSSNLDAWSKNIKDLKEEYTCVAIDLPGYGKSSKPTDADYTPTYFAEVIARFMEKTKLKNVTLVGHSMGGQASIKLAVDFPEKINHLILIAPAGVEKFEEAQGNIIKSMYTPAFVANTTDEQIKANYAINFYEQPEDVDKMIKDRLAIKKADDFKAHCEAICKSIAGMLDDAVFTDLEDIKHETLVVYGENDMLIPNRYFHSELDVKKIGGIASDNIKNSTVEYVEKSGHFVQYEKPTKVNSLIKQFLENN